MTKDRLIPAALLTLSLVPVVAGSLRLAEFAGAAATLPDGARVASATGAVVTHIVSVTVFSVLGAFQFAPRLRRGRPGWHGAAGRIVAPAGMVAALSGIWLGFSPAAIQGGALAAIRLVVGAAMAAFLTLGVVAVRRRDFTRHRAWMIRGYALGLGAGTQAVTQGVWLGAAGALTPQSRILTMVAAWLINVAVAEWVIGSRGHGRANGARPARETRPARPCRHRAQDDPPIRAEGAARAGGGPRPGRRCRAAVRKGRRHYEQRSQPDRAAHPTRRAPARHHQRRPPAAGRVTERAARA